MIAEDYVPYMGEWAELRKNYLLEEKPEDFEELVESKLLLEYFEGFEELYSNKFDELVEEQMEYEGINEELKSQKKHLYSKKFWKKTQPKSKTRRN